ncbi:hypothetical protein GF325_12815, partial [Candidatus Bathyarchaeota archaeon]|nr:hypothetical protein [Candidatus Bathyarchaeota archaeon]
MNSNLQERLVNSSRSLQFVQSILVIAIASREIYSLVTGLEELGEYIRLGLTLLACLGVGFMIKYYIKERVNLLVVTRLGIATVTSILFFVKKWLEWELFEFFLAIALIQAYLETISIPRDI